MWMGISKGRWAYVGAVVLGCLAWRLFGSAQWKDAGSLAVFLICAPIALDFMIRRK